VEDWIMDRRNRRQPDPILMGEPSPSLTRINRMNMRELADRIETLEREQSHLTAKIERLKAVDPPDAERIAALTTQVARLAALTDVARKRLAGKTERREQPPSNRPNRTNRPRYPRR
jgi:predicted RNase H-like nuclease (RuvC/YqgF family)